MSGQYNECNKKQTSIIGYKPINLNKWLKQSGCLGKIKDIHQLIIEDRNKED